MWKSRGSGKTGALSPAVCAADDTPLAALKGLSSLVCLSLPSDHRLLGDQLSVQVTLREGADPTSVLYECAAAIFIAQAYGYELTFAMQFSIVSIALLTSIGVAGVPSASLVAIAIILSAVGLPLEALGVLLVFDRLLDMARTSVNVWGDCSCATIVARLSGEETKVALNPEAEGRG